MHDSAKKLIEQANIVANSLANLKQYESGHLDGYMKRFKDFVNDHLKLAADYMDALNKQSLHILTQQYLSNAIKNYSAEIGKLNTALAHETLTNQDFETIKNCQENLLALAKELDNIIDSPADEQLKNDAIAFREPVKTVSLWINMFFEEREKIKIKRADYFAKSIEYQKLKQVEEGSKKKSSSSATPSTTPPSTLQQWRETPTQQLMQNCLNHIEKDLIDRGVIKPKYASYVTIKTP